MKYEHEISDKQFLTFFMPQQQRSAFFLSKSHINIMRLIFNKWDQYKKTRGGWMSAYQLNPSNKCTQKHFKEVKIYINTLW